MKLGKIVINDVGPRDGLQNQPKILTTEQRLQLIKALVDADMGAIEMAPMMAAPAATDAMIPLFIFCLPVMV